MNNPESYKLSAGLTQAVIDTLTRLPWGQVHQLMAQLMQEIQNQERPSTPPAPPAVDATPAPADPSADQKKPPLQ